MSRKMIEIHDLEKFYGAHHVLKKNKFRCGRRRSGGYHRTFRFR